MKKQFIFILLLPLLLVLSCRTPIEKQSKANQEAEKTKIESFEKQEEINDKGRAFVYGVNYNLDQIKSNRTVEIETAARFGDLAQLTLGNPSLQDAQKIREISDDLISRAEKKIQEGEAKLKVFVGKVEELNVEKQKLKEQYENDLDKIQRVALGNAEKAQKYEEEHTFWNSINPFYDLKNAFKKLFGWGVFLGVVVVLFNILETVFPQLKIVSVLFGWFFKIVSRIFPAMKSAAGVVSSTVYDGFKKVVLGYQHAIDALKNHPIEDEILKNFPDNKTFDKKEVKILLEQHSEQILELFRKEQMEHQNDETGAIVQTIKSETGIKPVAKKADI